MLRHGIMASSPNNFLLSDDDEEDVVVVAVGEDMHVFVEGGPPNLACCRVRVQNILRCSCGLGWTDTNERVATKKPLGFERNEYV